MRPLPEREPQVALDLPAALVAARALAQAAQAAAVVREDRAPVAPP